VTYFDGEPGGARTHHSHELSVTYAPSVGPKRQNRPKRRLGRTYSVRGGPNSPVSPQTGCIRVPRHGRERTAAPGVPPWWSQYGASLLPATSESDELSFDGCLHLVVLVAAVLDDAQCPTCGAGHEIRWWAA
jgi:hypothetical protein